MAGRDIERAQERRRRNLKILAGWEVFREAVYLLRRTLKVSPDIRRQAERAIRRELGEPHRLDPNIHNAALNVCLHDLFGGGIHTDEHQRFNRGLFADLTYDIFFRKRRIRPPGGALQVALFMDFDGDEFVMWADEVRGGALVPWRDYLFFSDKEEWARDSDVPLGDLIKPKRIWLDVTNRDLPRLHEVWPEIERLQAYLKTKPPPLERHRPRSVPGRRETVLGKTWEEIRAEIRRNPGQVTRHENGYIAAEAARKESNWLATHGGTTKAPDSLKREWRRQAKDNFYQQVIVHPSMRDLKLRTRRRGRHRKN